MKPRGFGRNLLAIDVETTGANPYVHEIVSIGAVLVDGTSLEEITRFQSLVRPIRFDRSDPAALAIHGLTLNELSSAPEVSDVIIVFLDKFGTDYTLFGWNIGFDVQFLRAAFRDAAVETAFDRIDYHRLDLWSVLACAWRMNLIDYEPTSLTDVCRALNIERSSNHSGLADALIAAAVLRKTLPLLGGAASEGVRHHGITETAAV